jgi:hypothetical protein
MIKFFVRFIILPIIILISIPIVILGLMYKPMDNPLKDLSGENFSLSETSEEAFNTFLESDTKDQPVTFSITDDVANSFILELLKNTNVNFLDTEDYVIENEIYGFSGAWISFDENEVEIFAKVDIFVPVGNEPFVFQTGIKIVLEPTINLEEISLEIESISIGNLPILWIFRLASWIFDNAFDMDVEETVNESFAGFGDFNEEELKVTINVKDFISNQLEADEALKSALIEMVTFISSAELIEIKAADEAFEFSLALQLLDTDIEPFNLEEGDQITSEADFEALFETLFDPYAIAGSMIEASLLGETFTPYVDISSYVLNQVLGYTLVDLLTDSVLFNTEIGSYEIEISSPFLRDLDIYVPVTLLNYDIERSFTTYIIIGTEFLLTNNNLEIAFESINLGTIALDDDLLESLFAIVPENDMIIGNRVIIKDVDQLFGSAGITLVNLEAKDDFIRIFVSANNTLDLTLVEDLVDDILDTFTTNPNIPTEVSDAATSVLAAVTTGNAEAIEEEIGNLLLAMETLSEEDQAILSAEINALLAASPLDFSDLFNFIPE